MTREDMAQAVESVEGLNDFAVSEAEEIAAELRKRCDNCRHSAFVPTVAVHGHDTGVSTPEFTLCRVWEIATPADGSGFCHRHEPKP